MKFIHLPLITIAFLIGVSLSWSAITFFAAASISSFDALCETTTLPLILLFI